MSTGQAAIYCRVSTGPQGDNYSLPTQEQACRKHAEDLGYSVTRVDCDVHSGRELWERPRLTLLREEIRKGGVNAVIAYDPDRLSRRQVHFAVLVDECERYGVDLLFVHGQHDKTAVGEFLANARAFASELEREKFRERSQRGMQARIASGKLRPSNRPLYGYAWNDDSKGAKSAYIVDEEKAAVVRRIFQMAAGGASLRGIAHTLNEAQIRTANGADHWTPPVVRYVLRHEGYKGVATANVWAWQKVGGIRKRVARPDAEHLALPDGTIPPIISAELFDAVQEKLARNRIEATRNNRDPEAFLLRSGFLYCGYCGKLIHTAWKVSRKASAYPAYTVQQESVNHYQCPSFSIHAAVLDKVVWQKVSTLVKQPEIIAAEVAKLHQDNSVESDMKALTRSIAEIERKQNNIGRSIAQLDDEDALAPLIAVLKSLGAQKRELENEQEVLQSRQRGRKAAQDSLKNIEQWMSTIAANVDALCYAERRDLLTALGVRVSLYRFDHVPRFEITASIPIEPPASPELVVRRC